MCCSFVATHSTVGGNGSDISGYLRLKNHWQLIWWSPSLRDKKREGSHKPTATEVVPETTPDGPDPSNRGGAVHAAAHPTQVPAITFQLAGVRHWKANNPNPSCSQDLSSRVNHLPFPAFPLHASESDKSHGSLGSGKVRYCTIHKCSGINGRIIRSSHQQTFQLPRPITTWPAHTTRLPPARQPHDHQYEHVPRPTCSRIPPHRRSELAGSSLPR